MYNRIVDIVLIVNLFMCFCVHISIVHLDFGFQVLPSVLQCLPLKEDFEENKTVFDCLCQLYLSGEQEVK